MKTIQAIKSFPIRAYLAERGLHPTKDKSAIRPLSFTAARRTHTEFQGGLCAKPMYDLGLVEGGSIIDLVMQLERCDFTQAVRLLGSGQRTTFAAPVIEPTIASSYCREIHYTVGKREYFSVGFLGVAFGTLQRERVAQAYYDDQ